MPTLYSIYSFLLHIACNWTLCQESQNFLKCCKWKLLVGIWKTFLPWWKLVFQMGNHKVLYMYLHVYFEFFANFIFIKCFMVMVSLASNLLKFQRLERRVITVNLLFTLHLFYLTKWTFKHNHFFSDEISTFLTMVSKLGYDEKPNYTKYKEVFKGGLKKLGVKDEWKLNLPISRPAAKVQQSNSACQFIPFDQQTNIVTTVNHIMLCSVGWENFFILITWLGFVWKDKNLVDTGSHNL